MTSVCAILAFILLLRARAHTHTRTHALTHTQRKGENMGSSLEESSGPKGIVGPALVPITEALL